MSRDSLRGFAHLGLLATLLQSFLRSPYVRLLGMRVCFLVSSNPLFRTETVHCGEYLNDSLSIGRH